MEYSRGNTYVTTGGEEWHKHSELFHRNGTLLAAADLNRYLGSEYRLPLPAVHVHDLTPGQAQALMLLHYRYDRYYDVYKM